MFLHIQCRLKNTLSLMAIVLVAFNLRPAISSIAPVLVPIMDDIGLTTFGVSVLTMLPVLSLGAPALIVGRVTKIWRSDVLIFWALMMLALMLVIRGYLGTTGLFICTALAGAAMGMVGILLPGVIKVDYGNRLGIVTGLYTASLSLGGASGAALTEPLRLALGAAWRPAIAIWAFPVLISAILWKIMRKSSDSLMVTRAPGGLWRNTLAWYVTGYMGLQSALAYSVFGWLPLILIERGLGAITAGTALGLAIAIQILSAILAPVLVKLSSSEMFVVVVLMVSTVLGLIIIIWAPIDTLWWGIGLIGLGQGGTFSIALSFIALKAEDAYIANRLSAMAQGLGYVAAAIGPFVVGLARHFSGGWSVAGAMLVIFGVGALICGTAASQSDRELIR